MKSEYGESSEGYSFPLTVSANQWNHRKKSVTDKQTNRQTNRHMHESVYRVAPQLKIDVEINSLG